MWKLLQGALPLGVNLEKRGCGTNVTFPRCGENETAENLILLCNFAKEVWTAAPLHRALEQDHFLTLKGRFDCMCKTSLSSPNWSNIINILMDLLEPMDS